MGSKNTGQTGKVSQNNLWRVKEGKENGYMLAPKLHPGSTNYVIIAILHTDRGKNRKVGTGRALVPVILLTCAFMCPPMSRDKKLILLSTRSS